MRRLAEHVLFVCAKIGGGFLTDEAVCGHGRPMPGIDIKIVDPDTRKLVTEDRAVGEIWVSR